MGLWLLLFNATQPTKQLLNFDLLVAYALGSLSLLVLGIIFRCFFQRKGLQEAAILTMGMTISNSAFMGFPIAEQIINETARATLAVYVSVENLIMLPLLLTLAELSGQNKESNFSILKGIIKRLMTNPLIISISAGVLFSTFELHFPKPISHALTMLSGASAPVALFYIGCTLAGLQLKGMGGDISSIIFGKLILHPLAIYVTLLVLSFNNPMLKQAAIINASMPMFSIYPLISQKYGYQNLCAAAMVATTVISFFTITGLLWLIQSGYLN